MLEVKGFKLLCMTLTIFGKYLILGINFATIESGVAIPICANGSFELLANIRSVSSPFHIVL